MKTLNLLNESYHQKESILEYLKTIKMELMENGISEIGLFGSFAKNSADLYSDIDIVIKSSPSFSKKFKGIDSFLFLDDLREKIERKFQRKVDICDASGLKNRSIIEGAIYA